MIKRLLILLIVCLLPSVGVAASPYYCDLSSPGSIAGDGSWGNPFKSIADVNAASFATGDDLYFKQGEDYTLNTTDNRLLIDWTGTSGNHVIIGCYEGQGDFNCSGARPKLSGNRAGQGGDNVPTNTGYGIIDCVLTSAEYITIEYLEIADSGGKAIRFDPADPATMNNITVDNCILHDIDYTAFVFQVSYGTVSNSIMYNGPIVQTEGGFLTMPEALSHHNTIEYNIFHDCYECAGASKKSNNHIFQYNVFYDVDDIGIYIDAGNDITIRYNLFYNSSVGVPSQDNFPEGIDIINETARGYCNISGNEVYGNMFGGLGYGGSGNDNGIKLACPYCVANPTCWQTFDVKIYNNTFADNYNGIFFGTWTGNTGGNSSSIEITNNLFYTSSGTYAHLSNAGLNGMTFSHNLYDDDPGGNSLDNSGLVGDPDLQKTTGWNSLSSGNVTGQEFSVGEDGEGINAGASLGAPYTTLLKTGTDYTDSPISISTQDDSGEPDIGAWLYGAGEPAGGDSGITGGSITGGSIQ